MNIDTNRGHAIIHPDDAAHSHADSKAPGEFRRPTDALGDQPPYQDDEEVKDAGARAGGTGRFEHDRAGLANRKVGRLVGVTGGRSWHTGRRVASRESRVASRDERR
jgi:hypothetical protein